MIRKSGLACNYWNNESWVSDGCLFTGLDSTHIRCICNHTTAFSPSFITPVLDGSFTSNSNQDTQKTTEDDDGPIKLEELLVPLEDYVKSLKELL